MSFPLFLRGFVIALITFAIANYAITQSLWTTFINTVICGVLIQFGYFVAVLLLIWRSGTSGKRGDNASGGEMASSEDGKPKGETSPLPGVGRSHLR